MALITCPKCGKEFSNRAQACPQCGYRPDNSKKNKRFVVYGVLLLVLQCIGLVDSLSRSSIILSQDETAVAAQGVATWSWSSLLFSLLLVLYFTVFWIRQAKSLRNTTQSIYAYVLAALSLVLPTGGYGTINPSVIYWISSLKFLCIGIFILLYGHTLVSKNKYFAIASGSLWIISFLFWLLFLVHLLSSISVFQYGVGILSSLSIISTIVFVISCYLPDWINQQ